MLGGIWALSTSLGLTPFDCFSARDPSLRMSQSGRTTEKFDAPKTTCLLVSYARCVKIGVCRSVSNLSNTRQ